MLILVAFPTGKKDDSERALSEKGKSIESSSLKIFFKCRKKGKKNNECSSI